jgi:hypothetical protein
MPILNLTSALLSLTRRGESSLVSTYHYILPFNKKGRIVYIEIFLAHGKVKGAGLRAISSILSNI